ncbi:hypothetical protein MPNT_340019 [Candidatus Methylacidithermus pantelleriae]|uniref:Uncharacterized protein n=1 Tax=Candidatus Methylacidithermus pantelleriae TaxID=2744239 RepID=A0A8J2BUJ4_9BACT|nr:hypothetical protein MPNT_340019 [Candidatus Methylacidithermus pantelleriae]
MTHSFGMQGPGPKRLEARTDPGFSADGMGPNRFWNLRSDGAKKRISLRRPPLWKLAEVDMREATLSPPALDPKKRQSLQKEIVAAIAPDRNRSFEFPFDWYGLLGVNNRFVSNLSFSPPKETPVCGSTARTNSTSARDCFDPSFRRGSRASHSLARCSTGPKAPGCPFPSPGLTGCCLSSPRTRRLQRRRRRFSLVRSAGNPRWRTSHS